MRKVADLFCQKGGSDKVYHVFLEPKDDGFVVNYGHAARGKNLKMGTKTQTPISLEKAIKVFDSLVKEKRNGGYEFMDAGSSPEVNLIEKTDTGLRPQLLNAIEEEELERLINDDSYIMQEKKDGERMMIENKLEKLNVSNRCGFAISYAKELDELLSIGNNFILDGEIMKAQVFCVFDILSIDGESVEKKSFKDRLAILEKFVNENPTQCLKLVRYAIGKTAKQKLLAELQNENAEGVVFKKATSSYAPGRPNTGGDQLKYKFYETASFVVEAINQKRSIKLALYNEDQQTVHAGNVTIPPNHEIPNTGDVVEVRYLYAFRESGSVFQPVFLGKRNDIENRECVTAQLKYKKAA